MWPSLYSIPRTHIKKEKDKKKKKSSHDGAHLTPMLGRQRQFIEQPSEYQKQNKNVKKVEWIAPGEQ